MASVRASSRIKRDQVRITRTFSLPYSLEALARYLDTHAARTRLVPPGHVLHRPSFVPVPSFGPRLVLGREGVEALVEEDQ